MIEVALTLQSLNMYELNKKSHHVFIAVNGGQQYVLFKEGDDSARIYIDEKTGKCVANNSNVKPWQMNQPDDRNNRLEMLQLKLEKIQNEIECLRRGD
jgi:hypothetical protein